AAAGGVATEAAALHQAPRARASGALTAIPALPLPSIQPYDQRLLPAAGDTLHLLWRDRAAGTLETRLYAARLGPALEALSGPNALSTGAAYHYSAAPTGDGGLWAVWSGGLPAEPGLFARFVDRAGRPQAEVILLANDADWPALAWDAGGGLRLLWREPSSGQLVYGRLADGALDQVTPTGLAVWLSPGDRLRGLYAALDRTHIYALWNVARAGGADETWLAAGALAGGRWTPPARLGVSVNPDEPFATGFNTGAALAARAGTDWLRHAAPLSGQHDALPLAAQTAGGLALVYLRGGTVAGWQMVVPGAALIGPAALAADVERHLYLAWAQPAPAGPADLLLTTTR
ncbi:MAG: hypothetical protein ACUVSX_08270, partial [Aggregatilineales bacterium]